MPSNNGKAAEEAFEAYWTKRGHLVRLWDAADISGLNGGARVKDFAKPADYLVSSRLDDLHFAEVKSCWSKTSFSFGAIQKGQSAAALQSAKRGDQGYSFYIFSYHHGKWFYMSCVQYREILDAGRKSVKFEELAPWLQ
jgi:hypothetical protein